MLALAFVLMGKAVSALQEAALISMTPLPVNFEIDWIGVKSTWQGVVAQTMVVLAFMVLMKINGHQNGKTLSAKDTDLLNTDSDKTKIVD